MSGVEHRPESHRQMPCHKCGTLTEPSTLLEDGAVIGVGALCDSCFSIAAAGAELLRTEFDALIAAGVPRDRANRLMIDKMEGRQVRA